MGYRTLLPKPPSGAPELTNNMSPTAAVTGIITSNQTEATNPANSKQFASTSRKVDATDIGLATRTQTDVTSITNSNHSTAPSDKINATDDNITTSTQIDAARATSRKQPTSTSYDFEDDDCYQDTPFQIQKRHEPEWHQERGGLDEVIDRQMELIYNFQRTVSFPLRYQFFGNIPWEWVKFDGPEEWMYREIEALGVRKDPQSERMYLPDRKADLGKAIYNVCMRFPTRPDRENPGKTKIWFWDPRSAEWPDSCDQKFMQVWAREALRWMTTWSKMNPDGTMEKFLASRRYRVEKPGVNKFYTGEVDLVK